MAEYILSSTEAAALDREIAILEEKIEDAARRMAEARKEGDLRENEEYSIAENELFQFRQELQEKRIKKNESRIVASVESDTIKCGSYITLTIGGKEYGHINISSIGAIPGESISATSKLGSLLIGKRAGDQFEYIDNIFRRQRVEILEVE